MIFNGTLSVMGVFFCLVIVGLSVCKCLYLGKVVKG